VTILTETKQQQKLFSKLAWLSCVTARRFLLCLFVALNSQSHTVDGDSSSTVLVSKMRCSHARQHSTTLFCTADGVLQHLKFPSMERALAGMHTTATTRKTSTTKTRTNHTRTTQQLSSRSIKPQQKCVHVSDIRDKTVQWDQWGLLAKMACQVWLDTALRD
jgi:hypothetical protein